MVTCFKHDKIFEFRYFCLMNLHKKIREALFLTTYQKKNLMAMM